MKLSYEVVKGHRAGIWYYYVYASHEGQKAKIRGGNTPYSTKREAEKAAQEKVQELEEQYKGREKKKYYGKHGDERPNKKITYGYKMGRLNEYHVTTASRTSTYTYQNVNAYGQAGVQNAKRTGRTLTHGRAYKNVVYNRTRKHYVGKNRLR